MTYNFYGWKTADCEPLPEYKKEYLKDPRDMYDIMESVWTAETCAPRFRPDWSTKNRTLGQCSITSFLVQDIFGGEVYAVDVPDVGLHCYNKVGDCVFDLTSEQFGEKAASLVYDLSNPQSRAAQFESAEKKARYDMLKENFLNRLDS